MMNNTPGKPRKTAVIVVLPSSESARRLTVPDGDDATDLHCTLDFLAEADREAIGLTQLALACKQVASTFTAFTEHVEAVSGLGNDDPQAMVLRLTNTRLGEIRDLFRSIVPTIPPSRFPDYTPHITLGYGVPAAPGFVGTPIPFNRIAVWWGDDRLVYPLH